MTRVRRILSPRARGVPVKRHRGGAGTHTKGAFGVRSFTRLNGGLDRGTLIIVTPSRTCECTRSDVRGSASTIVRDDISSDVKIEDEQ